MEMQLHCSFVLSPAISPYIKYIKIQGENVHLMIICVKAMCKFVIFCDSEK